MEPATCIACLTPPGRGAIATLALRGPRAWTVVRELFRPLKSSLPEEPRTGRFWLGRLGEPTPGGSDEVVLAVTRAGEVPWVELHCHGGPEVLRLLLEMFADRGVTVCSWQELEERTGEDPLRAQAQIALAHALTVRTAGIVLDQLHGACARQIADISVALGDGDPRGSKLLQELVNRVPLGRHLTQPWRVVVAGATNVGKSSLINAIAGFQRCLVDPTPGTTRDVVTTLTAIDGWPVEFADTAGWRQAEGIEGEGIRRAQEAMTQADLCLWVLDGSAAAVFPNEVLTTIHYVVNKIDLPPAWDTTSVEAIRVSAKTGNGLGELCQAVSRWLVPEPPPPGAAVPFSESLCAQVEQAWQLLTQRNRYRAIEVLTG